MCKKNHIPGKKGAIARLIVMSVFAVIGLTVSFLTIPEFVPKVGLRQAVSDAFSGCSVLLLLGAFFWGFMKWIAVVGKSTFRAAGWLWRKWPVFTVFGLFFKSIICLLVGYVPTASYGLLFALLPIMAVRLAKCDVSILAAIGLFLLSLAAVAGFFFLDIRKLRKLSTIKEEIYA